MPKALFLFAVTVLLMIALPRLRAFVALFSAGAFLLLGLITPRQALQSIDWNVILMIGGTMGVVALFTSSGMPGLMADAILRWVPDVRWAAVALALLASVVSAFVDNVATVLMIAPVALSIAEKQRVSPVRILIAIAVSSNLQGAATLVGDTTSVLLAGAAEMDFLDFFWFQGRVGLFWIVQAGCLAAMGVLLWHFRDCRRPVLTAPTAKVTDFFPTVLMGLLIVLLIAASFFAQKPRTTNGLICTGLLCAGLLRELLRGNTRLFVQTLGQIDAPTLVLLLSLLVIIGALTRNGVIDELSRLFVRLSGTSAFSAYTLVVVFSVAVSAFVDNIPYVATMLPVMQATARTLGMAPWLLYFGLIVGATLGGNLTPIGASANITAVGLLEKRGYHVKNGDFLRIGLPCTAAAVLSGYALLWLIWH